MGIASIFVKAAGKSLTKSSAKSSRSSIVTSMAGPSLSVAKGAGSLAIAGMSQIYALGAGALTLLFFLLR
jgi:hypothetical protein